MQKRRKAQWKFSKVAKIRNLQISQVAKFRNTATLHSCVDCFLTHFFVVLYQFSLDVILVPLHIFCNFLNAEHLCKLSQACNINQSFNPSINKVLTGSFQLSPFPLLSIFSLFFSLSFHFLGSQTPFEDDNSEDERLKPSLP